MIEKLAVLVPSWKRYNVLTTCLDSIQRYRSTFPKQLYIVCCIQQYEQNEVEALRLYYPEVAFLVYDHPIGCGNAKRVCNLYVHQGILSVNHYLCLDDDMEFTEHSNVNEALKLFEEQRGLGFVGCTQESTKTAAKVYDVKQDILYMGSGLLFTRQLVDAIGSFDKTEYLDDMEFTFRAYLNGFVNIRTTRSVGKHKHNPKGPFVQYTESHMVTSRLWNDYGRYIQLDKAPPRIVGTNKQKAPGGFPTMANAEGRKLHEEKRALRLL